jgi:hypothetical protein
MTPATQFSVAAVLISLLCAACGGRNLAGTANGSAGSGGRTADAATETASSMAGSDAGADLAIAGSDGRADLAIAGSDGRADLANDARGAGDMAPPRLAANGVPIPPPRLGIAPGVDPCVFLDLKSAACSTSSACAPLSCDCGGNPLVFEGCTGPSIACVVGLSCPFACALGPDAQKTVIGCMYGIHPPSNPTCTSNAECEQPDKCLVFSNTTIGECVTGQPSSPCLANTDCQPPKASQGFALPPGGPACVVGADGLASCKVGLAGDPCNTDEQCSAGLMGGISFGYRCVIPPGAFTGACLGPSENSLCFTQHDCQPQLQCVAFPSGKHVCSSRGPGAPCEVAADCDLAFCTKSYGCRDGAYGSPCSVDSDCQGLCDGPMECGMGSKPRDAGGQ